MINSPIEIRYILNNFRVNKLLISGKVLKIFIVYNRFFFVIHSLEEVYHSKVIDFDENIV